jgi:hypothetical protein
VNGRTSAASAERRGKTGKGLQHETPLKGAAYTVSSWSSWCVRVVISSRNKAERGHPLTALLFFVQPLFLL